MNRLSYRGYEASIDFDPDDRILVGRVLGVRDIIGFHGASVDAVEQAFREAIDAYVDACDRLGQAPDRPVAVQLSVRLAPDIRARAERAAQVAGIQLDEWVERAIAAAAGAGDATGSIAGQPR